MLQLFNYASTQVGFNRVTLLEKLYPGNFNQVTLPRYLLPGKFTVDNFAHNCYTLVNIRLGNVGHLTLGKLKVYSCIFTLDKITQGILPWVWCKKCNFFLMIVIFLNLTVIVVSRSSTQRQKKMQQK